MSVIFHTNAGAPALAGDMLLSIPGPTGRTDLRLPSQPSGITIPTDQVPRYIPVAMRRKIFIVNDRLAVGTAGSALHVGPFVHDLIGEFRNKGGFTRAEVGDFLERYASSRLGGNAYEHIGALVIAEATDWRGSLTKGLRNHKNIVSGRFGRVIAIGTGSDSIINQVQRLANKYRYGSSQPPDGNERFPEFGSLSMNLILLANIYWTEFASPSTVFDAWGGAYDLIYQDSNRTFRYLDEYTIFLRRFDVDRAENGIQLVNVLKYERRPDVSFITMLNNGRLDFFGAKDITASDAPIEVRLGGNEFTMNSRVHISIIEVGKGNRFLPPMIQVDGLDPEQRVKQTVFTWFDEDRRLCVAFHAEHDEWLKEQATSYYQDHARKFR